MGVLPCQFKQGTYAQELRLDGSKTIDLEGLVGNLQARQDLTLIIHRSSGAVEWIPVTLRIDTPIEVECDRMSLWHYSSLCFKTTDCKDIGWMIQEKLCGLPPTLGHLHSYWLYGGRPE
jgi:hypothetical protein